MRSDPQVRFVRQPQLGDVVAVIGTNIINTFPRHVHESYCLGIVDRGARRITSRGTETVIPTGRLFILNPGESHSCEPATKMGYSYRVITISALLMQTVVSQISDQSPRQPYFSATRIEDERLITLFSAFFSTLKQPDSLLEQQASLLDLLSCLILFQASDPPQPQTGGGRGNTICHVQEMMRTNYADRLTLDELSAMCGLSPYHFQRVFTHEVGISPHDYLEQIRIQRAQKTLLEGGSIADTALAVGFVDQSHFTRTFKNVVGIPPGKYVRLHKA